MSRDSIKVGLGILLITVISTVISVFVRNTGGGLLLSQFSLVVTIVLGLVGILIGETQIDVSVDLTGGSSHPNHAQSTPNNSLSGDWGPDPEDNKRMLKQNAKWRRASDRKYEIIRKLGSTVRLPSVLIRSVTRTTRTQLKLFTYTISIVGGVWFLLLMAELGGHFGFDPDYVVTLNQISPFKFSSDMFQIYQFISAVMMFLPIGYFQFKSESTCPNCGSPFAKASAGKFWHPQLREQREEEDDLYMGVRFSECVHCEKWQQEDTSWVG